MLCLIEGVDNADPQVFPECDPFQKGVAQRVQLHVHVRWRLMLKGYGHNVTFSKGKIHLASWSAGD